MRNVAILAVTSNTKSLVSTTFTATLRRATVPLTLDRKACQAGRSQGQYATRDVLRAPCKIVHPFPDLERHNAVEKLTPDYVEQD
jgi:hypothetical protein